MPQPQQLRMYDPITDEDLDLGIPSVDVNALLGIADMMAEHPALIVHVEPVSRLRRWDDEYQA